MCIFMEQIFKNIMEFRRFRKRKLPNNKRSIYFIVLLLVVIYLWLNAESVIARFF